MTDRITWRCFHCNEEFVTTQAARDHFGATEESQPACLIKAGAERSLLKELRHVEQELLTLQHQVHNDATEAIKQMHAQLGRHHSQLIAMEELGYERGLRDARKEHEALLAVVKEWVKERKTFIAGETPKCHDLARDIARLIGETIP